MFTQYTFQDWEREKDKLSLLPRIVSAYKGSADFLTALEANDYFNSDNRAVLKKTVLKARTYETQDGQGRKKRPIVQEAIPGARIASNFFFRFVTQENQYLLGNGVTLETPEMKARLGPGFDSALELMGERALIQGVCWGFWNVDHLEVIEAARDALSGFVALPDEETGAIRLGVEFWQVDRRRPQYIRLFEEDGVTVYRVADGGPETVQEKRPYRLHLTVDGLGAQVTGGENYGRLPVIPLYGNSEKRSELTRALKDKIDLYDRILSDFGDNLERANDVYWVLNNFGGTMDEIAVMIEQINRLKIISNISDGSAQSTAQPHAFEVPYQARQTALELLRRALHQDFMALSMDDLTGGSLTNVAIQAATMNLNLKCDRFEWQVFSFVQQVLRLIGVESEKIRFTRQDVVNRSEIIRDIAAMRGDIDQKTALELNPYILPEAVEEIMERCGREKAP